MTPDYFKLIYADSDLKDFMHDMACRLSPTPECAQDAEQEAWLAIHQAPDGVSVASLKAAVVTSVASAVWQERKPRRAWKRWVAVLQDFTTNGAMVNGKRVLWEQSWEGKVGA